MPAALDRQSRLLQELLPPTGVPTISAAYQMMPGDHNVRFTAGAAYTITLPPVKLAEGQFYCLRCISGVSTVTVVDRGDAAVAISDTLNALNEVMMVYSDGEAWHFIITPPA